MADLDVASPEEALDVLLGEWRISRSAELSEAIELVRARIDAARPRHPPGKQVSDRLARWSELEGAHRAADVGELIRTLLDVPGHELGPRLEALLAREPDPGIASGLVDALDLAFKAQAALWHHYKTASAIVIRHGDRRVLAMLDDRSLAATRNAALSRKNFYPKTGHELGRVLAALPTGDGERDRRVLALARAQAPTPRGPGDGPSLLAAIYADPTDDGARQVYADFLIERDDPRGELISLQLARARGGGTAAGKKRENELLRTYGNDWLGAIAPVIQKTGRVFERGFLHAASVSGHGSLVIGAIEWVTVAELDIESWKGNLSLVTHEVMRSLRTIRGVSPHAMATTPLRAERIGFLGAPGWFARYGFATMLTNAASCIWPNVTHLEVPALLLPTDDALDGLWASTLARRLATIEFTVHHDVGPEYGQWVARLSRSCVPIVRATFATPHTWSYQLTRDGAIWSIVATFRGDWRPHQPTNLATAVRGIPPALRGPVRLVGVPTDVRAAITATLDGVALAFD